MKFVKCGVCGGSGYKRDTALCPRCKGTGVYRAEPPKADEAIGPPPTGDPPGGPPKP